MVRLDAPRPAARTAMRLLRFGPPLAGLSMIGYAVVIPVGGGIGRWPLARGARLIRAGLAAKPVPAR